MDTLPHEVLIKIFKRNMRPYFPFVCKRWHNIYSLIRTRIEEIDDTGSFDFTRLKMVCQHHELSKLMKEFGYNIEDYNGETSDLKIMGMGANLHICVPDFKKLEFASCCFYKKYLFVESWGLIVIINIETNEKNVMKLKDDDIIVAVSKNGDELYFLDYEHIVRGKVLRVKI